MLNFGFGYLLCEVVKSWTASQNKFVDHFCKSRHYLSYEPNSPCHCSAHTHNCNHTHFFSPLHHVSFRTQHLVCSEWSSQQVQCSWLSGQCREWLNTFWKKEPQCRSACPVLIIGREPVARGWRPVTALWAARRWPLSLALHGCLCHYLHSARFLFKCWGTFFPQVCVAQARRGRHQGSKRQVAFLISTS